MNNNANQTRILAAVTTSCSYTLVDSSVAQIRIWSTAISPNYCDETFPHNWIRHRLFIVIMPSEARYLLKRRKRGVVSLQEEVDCRCIIDRIWRITTKPRSDISAAYRPTSIQSPIDPIHPMDKSSVSVDTITSDVCSRSTSLPMKLGLGIKAQAGGDMMRLAVTSTAASHIVSALCSFHIQILVIFVHSLTRHIYIR